MEDLHWSLNPKILLDLKDNAVGSPCVKNKGDQTNVTHNMPKADTTTKDPTKYIGTDHLVNTGTIENL